ncbi:MAG: hypothetical protein R3E95_15870 [Thiolinea sp.]
MIKNKHIHLPGLPFGIAITLFITILLLIGITVFALLNFSAAPPYPDNDPVVAEQSFGFYVGLVNTSIRFLTTLIGILVAALFLTIILLGIQMYLWSKDRRKLADWQNSGLVVERLEFLSGNRLRLNGMELELNRAQLNTLHELVKKRIAGEPLHQRTAGG